MPGFSQRWSFSGGCPSTDPCLCAIATAVQVLMSWVSVHRCIHTCEGGRSTNSLPQESRVEAVWSMLQKKHVATAVYVHAASCRTVSRRISRLGEHGAAISSHHTDSPVPVISESIYGPASAILDSVRKMNLRWFMSFMISGTMMTPTNHIHYAAAKYKFY